MAAFLIYIVKSTLGLVLFYFSYKLLLSNETFFPFNRKILIGGLIACLLLPLVKVKTDSPGFIQQTFIELEKVISLEETGATERLILPAEIPQTAEAKEATGKIPYGLILTCIYLTGGAIAFTLFLRSFIHLLLLIRSGRKIRINDYVIVVIDQPLPPFNWWKYIVLPQQDYEQHAEEILTHELAHYHKRHSSDVLFAQIILLFHWFNPAAWLLKRELQDIHEYQADREVIKNGIDATKYQLLLVKKAVGSSSYTLANSFNQSKLKKRITMMCKKQSNHRARWKSLLLIPVAICTLYAFARPEVNRQLEQLIPGEGTIISQDNKKYTPEYFEAEYEKYRDFLFEGQTFSEYEKLLAMDKVSHTSFLLVNSMGAVMYNNEVTPIDQLEKKFESMLSIPFADNKPILIYMQHDRGTPNEVIAQIYTILQRVFTKKESFLAARNQKTYFGVTSPVYFGITPSNEDKPWLLGDDQVEIIFNTTEKGIKVFASMVVKNGDTPREIRQQIKNLISKEAETEVEIKANKGVPMGVVSDLKQLIREVKEK